MRIYDFCKEACRSIQAVFSLLIMCLLPSLSFAAEPINVAGVYEYDAKPDGVRKQMYLTLDFINGTPDFTQVFTGKESSFRRLPKDFMNAKKLSRNFSGTKAPGFGKYKEKFLFSHTEEFKLTNPRLDDGVIIAEWVNTNGEKGECEIIVNEDRSLRIYGLTKLSRDFSPDGIEIGLVEDRLPKGATPFVTPKEIADFMLKEYEKSLITPKVTTFDNDIATELVRAEQKGNTIEVKLRMKNNSNYEALNIRVADPGDGNTYAETQDGSVLKNYKLKSPGSLDGNATMKFKKGEWTNFSIIFEDVNKRIDHLSNLKFDNYIAGGFLVDNPITRIENIPVFQIRPKMQAKSKKADIQLKFDVDAPSWTAVASTSGDKNINIRKTPSSSAARPLVDEMKINNYQVPVKYFAEWSTAAPKGNVYALMFEPGEYAPVLKEQNGWYELMGIGANAEAGWVSAQFCKKYDLQPVTKEDLAGYGYKVFVNASGIYAVSMEYDEMDNYASFTIGKVVNGILVSPYALYADVSVGPEWNLSKRDDGYMLQVSKKDTDEYGTPDISKIPENLIAEVIKNKQKIAAPSYLCKANGEQIFVR